MPLKLETSPLPQPQQQPLNQLLSSSVFVELKRVIDAKALGGEVEASNEMAQGFTFDKFNDKALAHLKEAKRFRFALEVLEEIQKDSVHATVVKITTT